LNVESFFFFENLFMKSRFIMALDCGSTNFKAAVFDDKLRRLGEYKTPLRYTAHGPERVEFDAETTWRITVRLIRRVCMRAGLAPAAITTLALTSQANTFCALDAARRPLMPFMSWQDQRAHNEASWLNRQLGTGFHRHCSWPRLIAGNQAAMTLWLKRHKPAIVKKTAAFVTVPGFLIMRLGFPNAEDVNLAAMSGLYSLKQKKWWKEMLDLCGLKKQTLPMIVPLGKTLRRPLAATRGRAKPQAEPSKKYPARRDTSPYQNIHAKTCMFSEKTLKAWRACSNMILPNLQEVVLAGNDQSAGAFGNCCSRKKIVVTLGTALVVYRVMNGKPGEYTREGCWGPYPGGGCYELVTRNQGCSSLDWARKRVAPGKNIRSFTQLARKALLRLQASEKRVGDTFFYPDAINTNRAWIGSSDAGGRALAVLEGIGFTLKYLVENKMHIPPPLPEICITGGGSANAFWLQVLAGILNAPVVRSSGDALLGAARQVCRRTPAGKNFQKEKFLPHDAEIYQKHYERWKRFCK
jgi:sugar (pentulose or hexulose) kinase